MYVSMLLLIRFELFKCGFPMGIPDRFRFGRRPFESERNEFLVSFLFNFSLTVQRSIVFHPISHLFRLLGLCTSSKGQYSRSR
jgi:hypothetical protein